MVRETLDMTGLWRCQPDPYGEGEAARYFAPDCDVRLWREAAVPSSFDSCAPGMDSYEGPCWYRRGFRVPRAWQGKRVVLRFEGVNCHARVWINGQAAGEHQDGFLRFELPVHRLLRFGEENVVAVRVDNVRRPGEVPGLQRGWRPYGGILREVCLIATDLLHIEGVRIAAEPDGEGGRLALRARLVNGRGRKARCRLTADVAGPDGLHVASLVSDQMALDAGQEEEVELAVHVPRAAAWSPEHPALYAAGLQLHAAGKPADELEVRFGFRRVEVKDGKLLLNGKPAFLTGFNRHEDSPRAGMCTDLGGARRDILDMKAAGANFVRLCHYPHHPGELDLCDELGLLAMGEIPLYWWTGLEEGQENCARKLEAAKRQLTSMIRRDWNHPSVIFWSVSNENAEERPEVVQGNHELIRLAKQLDPTRLAAHVSYRWPEHPHFEVDDVVCVNGYPTWMASVEGKADRSADSARFWSEGLARLHERYPDKPILITEFGYPCLESVFGGSLGEDTQARAIEAEYEGMTAPHVCGTTLWCWADHPWPEEPFICFLTTSPFGVVTRRRLSGRGHRVIKRLYRQRQGLDGGEPTREEPTPAGWAVDMVRPSLDDIPEAAFPAGFHIRGMKPGEDGLWTDIQRDAEPYMAITDDLFLAQFGSDLPATAWRCFFIVDDRGVAVATISAWYDRHFKGGEWGRVHWVATRRAYQRRGLMRAGLSHTLRTLAQWHERAMLTTQTARLPAIKLYLDFGFVPDLSTDQDCAAWRSVRENLKHPALERLPV
jgi:GNAT superfamily N-acetyltransferase